MRITIDITEPESRSTIIDREITGQQAGQAALGEATAADGGRPPEALLHTLGDRVEAGTEGGVDRSGATDAGEPSSWLVDAITGRGAPSKVT